MPEYTAVVSRVLSAEKAAQQRFDQAVSDKSNLQTVLDAEIDEMRRSFNERVHRRLELLREQEDSYTDSQIAVLERQFADDLRNLQDAYTRCADTWVRKLFEDIINDAI